MFFIWLEGGFQCDSEEGCNSRNNQSWAVDGHLMTSDDLPEEVQQCGWFSSDHHTNPALYHATMVIIHYCSSDSWIGDLDGTALGGWYFQGSRVIDAVLEELTWKHGLAQASDVILGGCSAGGRGAMYNLDRVCGKLPSSDTRCRGLLEAAWWVPEPVETGQPLTLGAQRGLVAWNATEILDVCARDRPGFEYECMFGPAFAPYVQTPFFLKIETWDSFQLQQRGVTWNETWNETELATGFVLRDGILESLGAFPSRHAVFATGCFAHCTSSKDSFWRERVTHGRGSSGLLEALTAWLNDAPGSHMHVEGCGEVNCSEGCPIKPLQRRHPAGIAVLVAGGLSVVVGLILILISVWRMGAKACLRQYCHDQYMDLEDTSRYLGLSP